ncbi:MAG: PAS domain-containing protein, partial [Janthinobacterium lividum]
MKTVPTDNILASTLRAIGDGVISCDRDGLVYMMNAIAEDLTGWKEQEALGHPLKEVFVIANETSRETVEDPVDKVLRFGAVVGMANHTILIRRDGTELAIDDSAAPVHNADGELRGVVLVFRDVTERREAEFNLELLSSSGKVLGEAVDADTILSRIDSLITLHFADLAIFDLLLPSGDLERRVGNHRLPDRQAVVNELYHFIPKAEVSSHPTRTALKTKTAV